MHEYIKQFCKDNDTENVWRSRPFGGSISEIQQVEFVYAVECGSTEAKKDH